MVTYETNIPSSRYAFKKHPIEVVMFMHRKSVENVDTSGIVGCVCVCSLLSREIPAKIYFQTVKVRIIMTLASLCNA